MRPIIHVAQSGNIGNKMIQYMTGFCLAEKVPGSVLSGVELPEWNTTIERIPGQANRKTLVLASNRNMRLDLDDLAQKINCGDIDQVIINMYCQHVDNFPSLDSCRELFQANLESERLGRNEILINIRGGEIFTGRNRHYVTLPIQYYKEIVCRTGLDPVFMGQLEDNIYIRDLREAFSRSRFIPSSGVISDFQMIRQARHIVMSVSSFSWLASWLSEAETIFMPLSGIFNPSQFPEIDLAPRADKRFKYYLFPMNYNMPVDYVQIGHRAMSGLWREITPEMIDGIRRGFPRFEVERDSMMQHFDEEYYLRTFPHIRRSIEAGATKSGFDHYRGVGFKQDMEPFELNRTWYFCSYPMAALEVGQGDFKGFHEHYVSVGKARGYSPVPPKDLDWPMQ